MSTPMLEGTWQAVSIEAGGNTVPAEVVAMLKYVFERDNVTLLEGGKKAGTGTFTLDPAKTPRTIEVVMTEGAGAGKQVHGFYELDGDTLTMCVGEERPTEFNGAGAAALVVLKREMPDPS